MPLPAACARTTRSWPWVLDPTGACCQSHLQRVASVPRAGVAVQRLWACVMVALEKVHGESQVSASAVLEGGAPMVELGACAPTRAGGRQRKPRCAGAAPRESGGVRLEDAARPIQTIGSDTDDKSGWSWARSFRQILSPRLARPYDTFLPEGRPQQTENRAGSAPCPLRGEGTASESPFHLNPTSRPVFQFTLRAQTHHFTPGH